MRTSFMLLFFCTLFTFIGCEKDNDDKETDLTKTEILLKKPWIVQEVNTLESNTLTIYERGKAGNDINYDSEVLTFTNSTSGTVKDIYGAVIDFTWSFRNAEQTKMLLTLEYPTGAANLEYNMVVIEENNFTGTLNYTTKSGIKVLSSVRRSWQP